MKLILSLFLLFCLKLDAQIILCGGPLEGGTLGKPVASGGGGGCTDTPLITSQNINNGTRNNVTGSVGMQIIVGGSPITVTCLGRWVISGNSQTHLIHLRDASCNDLATVTINCSGAPTAQYLYGSITPTTLSAGGTYYIMSEETSGGDLWYDIQGVTSTAAVTDVESAYNIGAGCQLSAGAPFSFVPVNLLYH